MAVKRDYYEVLGVGREASDEEIKRAFRRAAQRHHPDVDSTDGAEARFKELNEAYRVLSDPQRRGAYDMFGHAGVDAASAGSGEGPFGGGFGPFGDIFDAFFGGQPGAAGSRSRRRVVAGADLRYDLEIEFGEAISGVTRPWCAARCATDRGPSRAARLSAAPTATGPASGAGSTRRSWARW
jgi:molecular chaperone DnaJ